MQADEHAAWLAFFDEYDKHQAAIKAQEEHDAAMKAVTDALARDAG